MITEAGVAQIVVDVAVAADDRHIADNNVELMNGIGSSQTQPTTYGRLSCEAHELALYRVLSD